MLPAGNPAWVGDTRRVLSVGDGGMLYTVYVRNFPTVARISCTNPQSPLYFLPYVMHPAPTLNADCTCRTNPEMPTRTHHGHSSIHLHTQSDTVDTNATF